MLPIQERFIKYNFSAGRKPVEYIVIHDTGNFKKGANALMHYTFFNGGNRSASADYFVDQDNIIKFIPDDKYSWHVGDGKNKYGISNSNSVGIEICVNADNDQEKTHQNTIDLVRFLMNKYNLPLDKVVRHYDASRKNCPQTLNLDKKWTGWFEFKDRLGKLLKPKGVVTMKDLWGVPYIQALLDNGFINSIHPTDEPVTFAVLAKLICKIAKIEVKE